MAEVAGDQLIEAAGRSCSLALRRRPGRSRLRTPLLIIGVGLMGYVIWVSSSKPPRPVDPAIDNPLAGILANKKPDAPAPAEPPQATPAPVPEKSSAPVPVDLTPPKSRPTVGPSGSHIERSSDTVVQWADKADPSRLAGEFSYSKLEPIEAKRYLVTSPHAWVFLKDGWSIYIQSDAGRVYIPDEQATKRPESGTLRGNVIIKSFKPRPDHSRPDPEKDEPYLIAKTDSLVFDGSLGELSTPDRLEAIWEQGKFAGRGLTAIYNELKSRVEFAEIKEGEELIIHPMPKEKKVATAAPSAASPPGTAAPSGGPTTTVPTQAIARIETLYHALFTSEVKITQAQRTLTSDQLELWTRLVDGKLPADAFGTSIAKTDAPAALPPSASPSTPPTSPVASSKTTPSSPTAPAAAADPNQADIRLTWTGSFTIRTSDSPFAELEHDSLAVRFTAPHTGTVTAAAGDLNASARSSSLDYFASRRQLRMEGSGASGVVVAIEKSGTARASNLAVDLGRGSARMTGAGVLEGSSAFAIAQNGPSDVKPPTVSWSEQAELLFDPSSERSRLKEAIFTGDVNAKDHDASIQGGLLRAEFTQVDQGSMISHLTVQDHAIASDGAAGRISGDYLDATFKPLTREDKAVTPAIDILKARGNVFAKRAADQIHAGFLDVHFINDPSKAAAVSTVLAQDDVRLDSADTHATAAELRVDALTQIADLTGTPAVPATASRAATTIKGPALHMDGVARTLAVNGQGTLTHAEPSKVTGVADSHITTTWVTSLAFDDRLGTADLQGDVSATWLSDAASVDILKSRSLALAFTPYADPSQTPAPSPAPGAPKPESPPRELLRATAIGTEAAPATLESRRYDPVETGPLESRKPERVTYLEGARILADNVKGTLDVPVPGKLLVSDRRPGAQAQSSGSFAGDALFHWTDSLNVRREAETADMKGSVEVIHLRPGDADPTEMRCDQITATMRRSPHAKGPAVESAAHKNESSIRGEISRILASGHVWARSATKREITADLMDYDAPTGMMILSGNDGREISAFDPASGTPIRGKNLEWDLKLDRIRVKDVGGISVPR